MKTLPILIFLTLICFLHHSSAQGPIAPELGSNVRCCPHFTRMLIPKPKVKHVAMTSSGCKTKAIVVTTLHDKKSCIDPNWRWAKNLLAAFEKATVYSTSPSAPFGTSRATDVCNKKSCIDPDWRWAKNLLAEFETTTVYSLPAPELISEEPCCPYINRRLIPKSKVKHVAMTSSHCKTPAIVVTTVCDTTSCIDPEWRWAKKLLAEFEKATVYSTSPSAPFGTSRSACSNWVSAESCCPSFTQSLIPKPRVKHVARTSSHCKTPAIVVTTVCDTKSCIDPDWRWAKNLLAEFEKATANNTSPSAPFNTTTCERPRKQ